MEISDSRSPGFVCPVLSALFFIICVLKKLPHPAPTPHGFASNNIIFSLSHPIPRGHPYLDAQLAQACSKSVGRPGGSPRFPVILKKEDLQKIRSRFSRATSQTSRPLAEQAIPEFLPKVSATLQLLEVALKNLGVHFHIRCLQSRMDERKADGSCFMHGKASEFRIHRVGTKGVKTYVPHQVDPRNDAKHVPGPQR